LLPQHAICRLFSQLRLPVSLVVWWPAAVVVWSLVALVLVVVVL
jgi:hypothetical protein